MLYNTQDDQMDTEYIFKNYLFNWHTIRLKKHRAVSSAGNVHRTQQRMHSLFLMSVATRWTVYSWYLECIAEYFVLILLTCAWAGFVHITFQKPPKDTFLQSQSTLHTYIY
jgi:hypothetical protein